MEISKAMTSGEAVTDFDQINESDITQVQLDSGLTLLVLPMPWLRTAALSLGMRGGLVKEPDHLPGLAGTVVEMVQRGAGPYSSRELVSTMDHLGIDRNGSVSTTATSFGAACPSTSIDAALKIVADIVRRPHLPADQLDDARMSGILEWQAVQDDPAHRVMRRLRQRHYGPVLGRSVYGERDGLMAITADDIQDYFQSCFHAGGGVLGIAGNVNVDEIVETATELFGDWQAHDVDAPPPPVPTNGYEHIQTPQAQTHIGFAWGTIPYGSPEYFAMRAGVGILSDGMSSRLFDRVREQRGLCYTVSASVHNLPHTAGVFGYAGTTPARAQETLDVTLGEIKRLTEGLQQSELDRWKVRIESGLVMEQESASSRSSGLVSDFFQLGRPQSTIELQNAIAETSLDKVKAFWEANPPSDFRVVTLGEEELNVEC